MKETTDESLPRIAASSYLNTAPLIWSFVYGSEREAVRLLTDEAPARCAEMLARGEVDAALVIGDPAMKIVYRTGSGSDRINFSAGDPLTVFDLATLWHEHTGLGFVFAMWMARAGNAQRVKSIDFSTARDEGLAHLNEI